MKHDDEGIRYAMFLNPGKFRSLDLVEEEVIHIVRHMFGYFRGYLTSLDGKCEAIDWESFEMFSRKDEAVLNYPKIALGMSFEFEKKTGRERDAIRNL